MQDTTIIVRGAREHNLRNVHLELPQNKLIVFTGVSGSGKSSLAFDTLFAEGQRRYIESLSSYARQFLGQMPKPDVDFISGLSPAISIQQKTAGSNPRSTVGTITEIHDYLRVLFARVGQGHCVQCQQPITPQSRQQIVERILSMPEGSRCLILAPLIRNQKGTFKDLFEDLIRQGFVRARVNGQVFQLTDDLKLDRQIKHNIEVVIDRITINKQHRSRLAEAVEQALKLGQESVIVAVETTPSAFQDLLLSSRYACNRCGLSYEPPTPQLFSFNSPMGMCPECDGLGIKHDFIEDLLVPDADLSFAKGAVVTVGKMTHMGRWRRHIFEGVAQAYNIDLQQPWHQLPQHARNILLYGSNKVPVVYSWRTRRGIWRHSEPWEGIIPQLASSYKKVQAGPRRAQLEQYMRQIRCPACDGQRLNPQARSVRVANQTLIALEHMPLDELSQWFAPGQALDQSLTSQQRHIVTELVKEIRGRLQFLIDVGLHYLSLDRTAPTLSGGESQRIRLASQIGCGLVGVLYILDEPSIGLHPRDNLKLLQSLQRLRDMGNTVIVVEHDEDTMRSADYLVDFGPGPGIRGGQVVVAGTWQDVLKHPDSITGQYLSHGLSITIPPKRRVPGKKQLRIIGAEHNNLKNIDVAFPLGLFIAVTGVSGSGKSSLVNDVLLEGLRAYFGRKPSVNVENEEDDATEHQIGKHKAIDGRELIDKVIAIDQSPIGRTPRSNPATYIKVFDEIRNLYTQMPQAKIRGYAAGRFSFNVSGGRCEACTGNGSTRLEMDFLADVWVPCQVCESRRFNRETLQVRFKDKNIHDVLEMDVQEALEHFSEIPKIRSMLQTLHDVGLDYIKLGQPSPTLSGGEAQRIKLARELCHPSKGHTLYILDEPTTGLHFADIQKLLQVLHGFVAQGHTVVVIEHNLDVIKTADWVIDLGPEGGAGGGRVIAEGAPERIAKVKHSYTGQSLKPLLGSKPHSKSEVSQARKPIHAKQPEPITAIEVKGACQHNLKNINVVIPRDAMTICAGPSGSGKSSFAIDTVYAEGQRRYVESLSSYARQFLGQMQKPKVEQIHGLSPAICIEQKSASKSPRSTVGTVTEVYDYLRVLYARLGQPYCPRCQQPVGTQTADEIIEKIMHLPEGSRIYVLAPVERKGIEKYEHIWEEIRQTNFLRVRVDGHTYELDALPNLDHRRKHRVEIVVDRLIIRGGQRARIADAVEAALDLGKGVMLVAHVRENSPENRWKTERYSQHLTCGTCGRSFESLNPHHFSFNSPLGWCTACEGLGVQLGVSPTQVIRDHQRSLEQGALLHWPAVHDPDFNPFANTLCQHLDISLQKPLAALEPQQLRALLHGTGETWHNLPLASSQATLRFQYKGLHPAIDEAMRVSHFFRGHMDTDVTEILCSTCQGSRLRDDAAAFRFQDMTLGQLVELPLQQVLTRFKQLKPSSLQKKIAGDVLREIVQRLQFLVDVGLDYLTLNRSAPTLSGGEAQRIRLASQIGSGLTGVLYVLDEPTIGLHPRDNRRLLKALQHLRDLGNTLLLVEHDREVIAAADQLLDFGPGAGDEGGSIVANGTVQQVKKSKSSLTGQYLSNRQSIIIPSNRRMRQGKAGLEPPANAWLEIRGARQNNLAAIDVRFPLGCFIAVTGVSGSGKSSLINDVLYNALARKLHRARTSPGAHDRIEGLANIDKVINVDQTPIGNTPSSNPATYTGVFDLIRTLFAQLPEAKVRGYQPSRFGFNRPGGRCEACEGFGQKKIEMHFLPDVWVDCDVCNGSRYAKETLDIRFKEHSIADLLQMRIRQAIELFAQQPKIKRILQTLVDVGLDYLSLGQAAPTLSGGEAQRVKLAAELARPNTGKTLYILDEPTTGLHFDDIRKLLDVLQRLVDLGNTVIVVEHNLDVIKCADWIIDLGPEAGKQGGKVVAEGTPEQLVEQSSDQSHTAKILAEVLANGHYAERAIFDPKQALEKELAEAAQLKRSQKDDTDLPWVKDGKAWHTQGQRAGRHRWEGEALNWIVDTIQESAEFSPTRWNQRTTVEIAAKQKSQGWFFHAHTLDRHLLWLSFRVGKNAFQREELIRQLKLKQTGDPHDPTFLDNVPRVRVKNMKGPWQSIVVGVRHLDEIDTNGFKKFLDAAVRSFQSLLGKMDNDLEKFMPWKINGQGWHLGVKGFPVGKSRQWDAELLPQLLDLLQKQNRPLDISWNLRDAIHIRLKATRMIFARIKTKEAEALEVHFYGKKGQVNLPSIERFGFERAIETGRPGYDVIRIKFRAIAEMPKSAMAAWILQFIHEFEEHYSKHGGFAQDDLS